MVAVGLFSLNAKAEWINTTYWPYVYRLQGNAWEYAFVPGFWTQNIVTGDYTLFGDPDPSFAPDSLVGTTVYLRPDDSIFGEEYAFFPFNLAEVYEEETDLYFELDYAYYKQSPDTAMFLEHSTNSTNLVSRTVMLTFTSLYAGTYTFVMLNDGVDSLSQGFFEITYDN